MIKTHYYIAEKEVTPEKFFELMIGLGGATVVDAGGTEYMLNAQLECLECGAIIPNVNSLCNCLDNGGCE